VQISDRAKKHWTFGDGPHRQDYDALVLDDDAAGEKLDLSVARECSEDEGMTFLCGCCGSWPRERCL